MATKYVSTLTGAQMDQAMKDMNNHVSEAWATGTRGGTAVVSGDETYHNNAKYYSQNSATSASNASSSASSASASATSASNSASSASTSATNASNSANSARTYANNASASADRAEAIVGGQFISYGTNQVEGLTEAQHKTATYNVFGKPSTSTLDFLTRVSSNNYLAKIKKLEGKSVGVNQVLNLANGSWTNTTTDTRTFFDFYIQVASPLTRLYTYQFNSPENHEAIFTSIRSGQIQVKHNGSNSDLYIKTASTDTMSVLDHKYYVHINVTSANPSSVGGIVVKDFMLLDLTLIFGSGNEPSTVDNLKSAWLTKFGYPLPTYIPYNSGSIVDCEIKGIGSCGKNLVGIEGNSYTGSGSVIPETPIYLASGTYTLSYTASTLATRSLIMKYADGSGEQYSSALPTSSGRCTFTFTIDRAVNTFRIYTSGAIAISDIQIEHGSTATSYEPYSPYYRSFPIILRSAGTVKDTVEDTGNGYKVTRRVGTVDLGSLTWEYSNANVFQTRLDFKCLSVRTAQLSCGKYEPKINGEAYVDSWNKVIYGVKVSEASYPLLRLNDSAYSSTQTTELKASLSGTYLNYELATPITEYHSYNLTYPVTLNGTEYFDSPISVPCEIEYGVDALTDIASGVVNSPTDLDMAELATKTASNPNLLDNGWFTINQRGITSGIHNQYCADRWIASYGSGGMTWERVDGAIKITPTNSSSYAFIYQKMEDIDAINGKVVTMSVMFADGTIVSGSKRLDKTNGTTFYDVAPIELQYSSSYQHFRVMCYGSGNTIKAVKLELGSVSTLQNDNAPCYSEELRKCQRYFYSATQGKTGALYLGIAACFASTSANLIIPVNMRANPKVSIKGSVSDFILHNGSTHGITNFTIDGNNVGGCVSVIVTTSGVSAGQSAVIYLNSGKTSDIWLSAEEL